MPQVLGTDGPVQSGRVVTSLAMIVGSTGPLLCWELGSAGDKNVRYLVAVDRDGVLDGFLGGPDNRLVSRCEGRRLRKRSDYRSCRGLPKHFRG